MKHRTKRMLTTGLNATVSIVGLHSVHEINEKRESDAIGYHQQL